MAKPAKAFSGSTARVSTAAATAIIAAVRSGNAFRMTERIAAAKMAKRCHASVVSPAGTGVSQMPSARANVRPCLIKRAAPATDIESSVTDAFGRWR